MQIALYSNEFPPHIYGGAGVHIDFLSQELAKLAQVEVRCFGAQSETTQNMHVQGITSSLTKMEDPSNAHIKMFHNLSKNVEMAQATPEADIVHCHTWYTHLAGVFTRELLQVPLILTTHSLETHRPWKVEQLGNGYFLSRWLEQHAYASADGVIAVSEQMKTDVIEAYGVAPEKVVVVHNAVARHEVGRCYLVPQRIRHEKRVLFLGRVTFQKGPEYFMEAARLVLQKIPNVRFFMAGSGDMLPALIRRAGQLRMGRRFHFAGFLRGQDVDRMFALSDLYVMPSVSEPFGISPLEAMQVGTPSIISYQSGCAEILTHVIKTDYWDIDAMADAVYSIVTYPSMYKSLRELGLEEVNNIKWYDAGLKVRNIYNLVTGMH